MSIGWRAPGASLWDLTIPGKGQGTVFKNTWGLYTWNVRIWCSFPVARYSSPIARGVEDTLEDAKGNVEEVFNMIDFEEERGF